MVAISKIKKLDQVIESREFSLYFALEMFYGVDALALNAARQTVVVITSIYRMKRSCKFSL
jgi:hypothetical protein